MAPTPAFEIARKRRDGQWRIYFAVYRRPFRLYAFGRWLIGRPRR